MVQWSQLACDTDTALTLSDHILDAVVTLLCDLDQDNTDLTEAGGHLSRTITEILAISYSSFTGLISFIFLFVV